MGNRALGAHQVRPLKFIYKSQHFDIELFFQKVFFVKLKKIFEDKQ